MASGRLFYTRAASTRLQMLPAEQRLHVETHLENLALLVGTSPPERLSHLLSREEEGFVAFIKGVRVLFVVDSTARTLLIHSIEEALEDGRRDMPSGP
jgi:hypothetical protein